MGGKTLHKSVKRGENWVIRLVIIVFWTLFWLLNFADKVSGLGAGYWMGKDRLQQFADYFLRIGVTDITVPYAMLVVMAALEMIAFLLFAVALVEHVQGHQAAERKFVFHGVVVSLIIFTIFAIGDQLFGDRFELLEHSIYWISVIITWFLYTTFKLETNRR